MFPFIFVIRKLPIVACPTTVHKSSAIVFIKVLSILYFVTQTKCYINLTCPPLVPGEAGEGSVRYHTTLCSQG